MQKPTAPKDNQRLFYSLDRWTQSFLTDCRVRGLSANTLTIYRNKLSAFLSFSKTQNVSRLDQVDTDLLRRFFLWLEETGHNPGGRHAYFRTLRTFFRWLEQEEDGFQSPLRKLKAPKLDITPIQGVEAEEVKKLLATCGNSFAGRRDKALILLLFDTGLRIQEALDLTWPDVDLAGGTLLVKRGKGGKARVAFFGPETRRALRAYAKLRQDDLAEVWVDAHKGEKLTYWGVSSMLRRRAKQAGLETVPSPHDFRRGAALQMLRNGADVVSVSRLLGHSTLQVTTRYLAQAQSDLQAVHAAHSPVNGLKSK